jgi:opacity protein-like surface antigen
MSQTTFSDNDHLLVVLNSHTGQWSPYLGVGAGLDYISANAWSTGGFPTIAADDDFGPSFQAEAGVRNQLSDRMEVGLGYKYLAAFSEKLSDDIQDRLSQAKNHTASLSFTHHF